MNLEYLLYMKELLFHILKEKRLNLILFYLIEEKEECKNILLFLLTNKKIIYIIMLTNTKGDKAMTDIINLLMNNGIGVVCVAYLIYFQNTTMKSMLDALNSINARLSVIEDKLERGESYENQ